MATFFNPVNLLIILVILGAVIALAIFVVRRVVRWVKRRQNPRLVEDR